jgi:hypothetical protein
MQTRTALRHLSNGEVAHQWGDGPLAQVADQLVAAFNARESERMDRAEVAASMVGTGPMLEVLRRRFAEVEAQSLFDASVPMVTRLDAVNMMRNAQLQFPKDRGLKVASAHLYNIWMREQNGILTVGDVARLRAHYANQYPKSKVAYVIEHEFAKVGFNTLPVAKLAAIATEIQGVTPDELKASFNTVCQVHGLVGQTDYHRRAQRYLASLVDIAQDALEVQAGVENGGDAAADRALRRMAAYDDPILRGITAQGFPPEPEMGGEEHGPAEDPMVEGEIPHDEASEMVVETTSPITGDPMVLELGVPEGEGEMEEPGMGLDITPEDVEGLPHFGQLSDFGGGEFPPMEGGDEVMGAPGVQTVEIEDPTAPGEMLDVTIKPQEDGSEMGGATTAPSVTNAPAAMGDMQASRRRAMGMYGQHYANYMHEKQSGMYQEGAEHMASAPPGWEGTVEEMKKEKDIDNPFALAWWMKNKGMKPHEKSSDMGSGMSPQVSTPSMPQMGAYASKTFLVYAIRGGVRGDDPIDVVQAESMPRALRAISRKLSELGEMNHEVRAPAEEFMHRALIVLEKDAGNYLYVVAEDKAKEPHAHGPAQGDEFDPEVNEQQPAQVALPGGGQDGGTVLKSDGGFAQPRSTRKITVAPSGSAVDRTDKVSSKGRTLTAEEIQRICAAYGFTAEAIEAKLLAAEPVTAGKWTIEIADDSNVHLRTAGRTFERELTDLDAVIADFQARAAYEFSQGGGGDPVGETGVASTGRAAYEVRPLYMVGCAQCGRISEYVMPDHPTDVRCAGCSFMTTASMVAVQLESRQAAAYPGYVLVSDVPRGAESQDLEMNARRLMTAIQQVVPQALGTLRQDARLEVMLKPADEATLNRIVRVLEDRFGVSELNARTAQMGAPPPQQMQTTVPEMLGVKVHEGDIAPTYAKPPSPPPTPIGMAVAPNAPAQGAGSSMPMAMPMQQPMAPPDTSVDISTAPGAGAPSAQATAAKGQEMKPAKPGNLVASRSGIWNVAYRALDGHSRVMPVEAQSEVAARRIFAMYDGEAEILRVTAQGVPPVPPAPAMADAGAPPGAEPGPPAAGGMPPPDAGMEPGMPGANGAPPGAGAAPAMSPEIQEAVRAAMLTLRNTGIDIASAVRDFQTQFKKVLERFGDETSPARQALGAEIIRAAQESWSKPALIDLTAQRRADKPPAPNQGAGVSRTKSPNTKMPAPSPVKRDIPTPKQINTQQPAWFSLGTGDKVLGPDSSTDPKVTESVVPSGKIKTQPSVPQAASGPLSDGDMDEQALAENKDPGTFGAGKPPKDGNTSYPQRQPGTSLAPTDLGRDSQTGNNSSTSKWDGVSKGAPNDRSRPGGDGAPKVKMARSLDEVMYRLASLDPAQGLTYLAQRSESGKWFLEAVKRAQGGEFPELELWNARDASIADGAGQDVIPQLGGPARDAWELALSVLV